MFTRKTALTYLWPVTVAMPSEKKPGEYDEQKFLALFESIPRDEAQAINAANDEAILRGDTSKVDDFLVRVVKDWKEVMEDDAKTPVPFSETTLREYCAAMPWFRIGLYRAWNQSQQGFAAGN